MNADWGWSSKDVLHAQTVYRQHNTDCCSRAWVEAPLSRSEIGYIWKRAVDLGQLHHGFVVFLAVRFQTCFSSQCNSVIVGIKSHRAQFELDSRKNIFRLKNWRRRISVFFGYKPSFHWKMTILHDDQFRAFYFSRRPSSFANTKQSFSTWTDESRQSI